MKYTTNEVAEILNVSDRTVRRYIKAYISFENKGFVVSEKMLEVLKKEYSGQALDNPGQQEYEILEGFTKEEYQEFQKRLIEYPLLKDRIEVLKKDIEYHRRSAESQNNQLELLLNNIQQRNFIEAKDKKIE